jgi:nitrite reductase/ring-hydroxylating ferredoxin subunit
MKKRPAKQSADGNAYGRPTHTHNSIITETGPGTPCGELMRRYWQPVEISERLQERPQKLRILNEDLILFRDLSGRPGLVTPRCAHRGANLYYGKVDKDGIRCPYHGWQFDVQGRCLDQPCEPEGSTHKNRIRQPWYPVAERYGLVWAYMGPPEKKPLLPRWDLLEDLQPDEKIVPDAVTFSVGGDETEEIIPWNWMHDWENAMDPHHVYILHSGFSGLQFAPNMGVKQDVTWEHTPLGMQYRSLRNIGDGREVERITTVMFPSARSVPNIQLTDGRAESIGWLVPVDDEHHRTFHLTRMPQDFEGTPLVTAPILTKPWSEMSEDERWATPGDWEVQKSQGPITLHSEEHLASSDKGVMMLRRLLKKQIKVVEEGGDPIGVSFDEETALRNVGSGNFHRDLV